MLLIVLFVLYIFGFGIASLFNHETISFSERRELAKEYKQKEAELREQFDLQMRQIKEDAKKAKDSSITKRDTSFMHRIRENVNEEPINENEEYY